MIVIIISLSICLTIFVITSAIVLIRRRKQNRRYPGQVIAAPVVVTSATHTIPASYTVTQIPVGSATTSYPTQSYSTSYTPQRTYGHVSTGQTVATSYQPNAAPYSIITAGSMNPPSYDVAVSQTS